jgi:hypothetical protein
MNRLNEGLLCYLTPRAKAEYEDLLATGIDADLALALLETLIPDGALYELPSDEEGSTP